MSYEQVAPPFDLLDRGVLRVGERARLPIAEPGHVLGVLAERLRVRTLQLGSADGDIRGREKKSD